MSSHGNGCSMQWMQYTVDRSMQWTQWNSGISVFGDSCLWCYSKVDPPVDLQWILQLPPVDIVITVKTNCSYTVDGSLQQVDTVLLSQMTVCSGCIGIVLIIMVVGTLETKGAI